LLHEKQSVRKPQLGVCTFGTSAKIAAVDASVCMTTAVAVEAVVLIENISPILEIVCCAIKVPTEVTSILAGVVPYAPFMVRGTVPVAVAEIIKVATELEAETKI